MRTAICAIIKDEHLFLEEWIEWHLGLGFNAIHLFEDKGSKSHEEMCEKYSNVYLRRYEDDEKVQELLKKTGSEHRQFTLYKWFADNCKKDYNWIAFIDIDEFVILEDGYTLNSFFSLYEDYPAIHLSWKMKGASGNIKRPKNVKDYYTNDVGFLNTDKKWRVKSIINTKNYQGLKTLHHSIGGVDVNFNVSDDSIIYEKAWLNHYFTKSWEDWCDRIFNRGQIKEGHRTLGQFFEINTDMIHLRNELISSVADKKPNGTYWLDKKARLIAGGNVRKILSLNREYKNIIFDLGFHNGDTSEYYLKNGYKVIGVECNTNILKEARSKFIKYINKGDLIVLDKCVSDKNNDIISFYISTHPVWSSCNKQIAERLKMSEEVKVETITLSKLIDIYGCPVYCKIDIEGNDVYAVRSLEGHKDIPQYISVEAECLGIGENSTINMIDELYNVGYRRFFIVDQRGNEGFRFDCYKQYKWFNYDEICKQFDELKKQHFKYGVWADIYASR